MEFDLQATLIISTTYKTYQNGMSFATYPSCRLYAGASNVFSNASAVDVKEEKLSMKSSKNLVFSNFLAVVAGAAAVSLAGCGQAPNENGINVPPPSNPIQLAQNAGAVPNIDPSTNGNNGTIDGEWIRRKSDTTCATGVSQPSSTLTTTPTSYSFFIDNTGGSIVITYANGRLASIPVQYTYTSQYAMSISRSTGAVSCFDLDKDKKPTIYCGGSFVEPSVAMNVYFQRNTYNQSQLVFQIDRDLMCNGGGSTSTLTKEVNPDYGKI
jgi:hypothetical protein